jgi:hypothetical protein
MRSGRSFLESILDPSEPLTHCAKVPLERSSHSLARNSEFIWVETLLYPGHGRR